MVTEQITVPFTLILITTLGIKKLLIVHPATSVKMAAESHDAAIGNKEVLEVDIEHPSITRTLNTGYPEPEPIDICSNSDCEKAIYKGDQVWKKGSELYCNVHCLFESFETKEEEING